MKVVALNNRYLMKDFSSKTFIFLAHGSVGAEVWLILNELGWAWYKPGLGLLTSEPGPKGQRVPGTWLLPGKIRSRNIG